MNCDINKDGEITITPCDDIERYALKVWAQDNDPGEIKIKHEDEPPAMGFRGSNT